jgi:3'-phosphoadenosine 5'-phosphosulfate sulfotransferase (PAPS reductase)/FAD synthetase
MQMSPNLASYDWILINSSAGKDSQAMLDWLVAECDAASIPRNRLVVVHADLGRVEWQGTRELAERQAKHYGLRFEVVSRPQGDLLAHVEQRGKWPSSTTRYCTSDHKRGQVRKVMTKLADEWRMKNGKAAACRMLNCMGLRAEESPARAKKIVFERDEKASNGRRAVDNWLPIHHWTTEQVWARIKASGVEHHRAYDLGMKRLSCVFCIFAPKSALLLAGEHNRSLLDEYVRVEQKIGHTFRKSLPIVDVRTALVAGERSTQSTDDGCWNM